MDGRGWALIAVVLSAAFLAWIRKRRSTRIGQQATDGTLSTRAFLKAAQNEFVAIDFETTGLDVAFDRIIEVGAIRYVNGQRKGEFSTLINPGCRIPAAATKVNQITNKMVANSPPIRDVLPAFLTFLGDSPLIAHNAPFDIGFLHCELQRLGLTSTVQYADLLSIIRQRYPQIRRRKLTSVAWHFGVGASGAHRAISDCRMVGEIVCIIAKLR